MMKNYFPLGWKAINKAINSEDQAERMQFATQWNHVQKLIKEKMTAAAKAREEKSRLDKIESLKKAPAGSIVYCMRYEELIGKDLIKVKDGRKYMVIEVTDRGQVFRWKLSYNSIQLEQPSEADIKAALSSIKIAKRVFN